ncbi:MAG TPA: PilZ domain-containing protein [Candidatus Omnitrophota bacterium]|nr:PilZ domain-containing protein [Candidatus Omnitrophota bacterium]HPT39365.1 PilZ domain-containing protein [Candidatus Omnitrophota bacterium]
MEDKPEGKNRRSAERKEVAYTLSYGIEKPYDLRVRSGLKDDLEALMLDLSVSGMSMISEFELPRGSQLRIKFTFIDLFLSGEDRIRRVEITGKVISHTQLSNGSYRIGIYFNEISEEDKAAITYFIRRNK